MYNFIQDHFDQMAQCNQQYAGEYIVLKYGGSIAAQPDAVKAIAKQAAFLNKHIGVKVIIVHGGKEQADSALKTAGFDPNDKDKETDLRITTKDMIPVFDKAMRHLNMDNVTTMNDSVAKPLFTGCSGYDHPVAYADPIQHYTGQISSLQPDILCRLCDSTIPVFYSVCHNPNPDAIETRLNVNADNMATAIAQSIGAKRLFLLTDIDAVLDKEGTPLNEVSNEKATQLIKDGTATKGMIQKLNNAVEAAKSLPQGKVVILNGEKPDTIIREILCEEGAGTMVTYNHPQTDAPKPKI